MAVKVDDPGADFFSVFAGEPDDVHATTELPGRIGRCHLDELAIVRSKSSNSDPSRCQLCDEHGALKLEWLVLQGVFDGLALCSLHYLFDPVADDLVNARDRKEFKAIPNRHASSNLL